MDDEATVLHKLIARKSTVTPLVGQLVSADSTGYSVDVGGGRIPARWSTDYLPDINEDVAVQWIDGVPYVVGPTRPQPTQGTVVSVGGGLVTVTTTFGDLTIPYNAALTPVAGQVLHLIGKYADSVMSTSPPPPVAPPPPVGSATTHVDTFAAIDAGSWNGSWSSSRLWASNTYLAAVFYGSKIADTLPASALIQNVEFYISPVQIQGSPPNFAVHTYQTRPAGAPTLAGATPLGITPGWLELPVAFGNDLKTGGGYAGIGFDHGGYNILHSLAEDSLSCAIKITSVY